MLEVSWNSETLRYTDLIPLKWLSVRGYRQGCTHDVRDPQGRLYPGKCSIDCRDRSLVLDYGGENKAFNEKVGWYIGKMRFDFSDKDNTKIKSIKWMDEDQRNYQQIDVSWFVRLDEFESDDPRPIEEGGFKFVVHRRIERASGLREKKIKSAKRSGHLKCEACDLIFDALYGNNGESACEVHHRIPLSISGSRKSTMKDKLEELAVLCASCHRVIHRTSLSVEELRMCLRK